MKYKGKEIKGPNEEIIVIPRGGEDQEDFIFTARAVLNYDDFDKLVKEPEPQMIIHAGDTQAKPLLDDPAYKKKREEYDLIRLSWLIVKSLEVTEDLEWDTVDMNNPKTCPKYDDELRAAGFSNIEIGRIVRGVMIANSLDQRKVDEARKHFLAMRRQAAVKQNSQTEDQKTTPSGPPASDLE